MTALLEKAISRLQQLSPAEQDRMAARLLKEVSAPEDTELLQLVRKIRTTPPAVDAVRPAQAGLYDALGQAEEDSEFNLESWEAAWRNIEAELEQGD